MESRSIARLFEVDSESAVVFVLVEAVLIADPILTEGGELYGYFDTARAMSDFGTFFCWKHEPCPHRVIVRLSASYFNIS